MSKPEEDKYVFEESRGLLSNLKIKQKEMHIL